jgi:hypothetical protein
MVARLLPPNRSTAKRPAQRVLASLLAATLLLGACANSAVNDPSLTPAQRQLREANASWNNTVASGALVGAAAGAAIGAAAANNRRGEAMLIGALIGTAAGLVGGLVVANRNFTFADREAGAQARIDNANNVASDLERRAALANNVVAQNRARIADLDRQYRAGQITSAQYRARTESMRGDLDALREGAKQGADARAEINRAQDLPQLRRAEERIGPAQRRLEASASELEELLRRVPQV